eukprot:CAMPEP_0168335112 /NCGR_PEP_ID=MMETSP0213-20121227/10703_1 /TAXON_ID=151035 /ORGANISM="Euplotes harpa, Strain FSP1.4" /LENGTH=113 /DNA_ID=CAMNT_0008339953 /DNA_START=304 /DNA_END=645 /DNA_ORIENTATION=-
MLKECYAYDSPPVGVYNPNDKYHIKSVPNLTNERFKEPSSLLKIKKSVPLGYLQNFNTFYKSLNMSKSNLPKANRFVQRELNERRFVELPKLKYSPKKCYDRFKAKTYFKELD